MSDGAIDDSENSTEEFDEIMERYDAEIDSDPTCDCKQCELEITLLRQDNIRLYEKIKILQNNETKVKEFYEISAIQLALRRLPALSITLILEMCGGLIINQLHEVIQALTLIVSFMPAISALSGNLGLQASSNTIRGLGTGYISSGMYCANIKKEVFSGLITATLVALIMSSIGLTWAYIEKVKFERTSQEGLQNSDSLEKICENMTSTIKLGGDDVGGLEDVDLVPGDIDHIHDQLATNLCQGIIGLIREENKKNCPKEAKGRMNPFLFAGIILIGTWISMMVSTLNGASTPVLAHMMEIDPAKVSGPLETAFQDIVGQSFLLVLAYLAFHTIQPII